MHDFFYEQSNYKVGASENYLQLDIKVKRKELSNKNYFKNNSDKNTQLSIKKFRLFEKLTKNESLNLTSKIKLFILFHFLAQYSFQDFYCFLFQNLKKMNLI